MKVAFIGGGNMGEAMIAAILGNLRAPHSISVSDISGVRRKHLEQKYGITVMNNNREVITRGDIVVLSIKPQNLAKVMTEINGRIRPMQLVLSIIAGARVDTLCLGLDHNNVVRAMPNTPAQIGEGISVWTATSKVTKQQKEWASSILGAMGTEVYVDNEEYIDMATAVSGSGPAYVFLFMESLINAAVHIGLPRNRAKKLVLETFLGSGQFAQRSGKELAALRRMVTSPGGTTAEALLQLKKGGFSDLITQAVTAAYNKAKSLGN